MNRVRNPIQSAEGLALLWGGLLILLGLVYRTYNIAMDSPGLEMSRQVGLIVLIAQVLVFGYSVKSGFEIKNLWNNQSLSVKILSFIFLSTFWISSFTASNNPFFSIVLSIGVFIQILFATASYHLLSVTKYENLNRARVVFVACFALFSLMILQRFLLEPPPPGVEIGQFSIPGFISLRLFGAVCGAVFAYLLTLTLLDEEANRAKPWHYAAHMLVGGLTIWSGTRVAVLGCAGALLLALFFYRLRPRPFIVAKIMCSLVICAAIAVMLLPTDSAFWLYYPGDYTSFDTATAGRVGIWIATWKAYLTVPIFGAGTAANSWMMPPGIFSHVQPHNVVLQFLINWGAIGGLSGLALLAVATWKAHYVALRQRHVLPVLVMLDCLLIMSLFDGILYFARETMMVMMCFAIIFSAEKADPRPI